MPQYIPPNYVHSDRPADVRYVAAKPDRIKGPVGSPFVDIKPGSSSDRPPFKPLPVTAITSPKYDYLPMTHMQLPSPSWWRLERELPPYPQNYDLRLAPKGDKTTVLNFVSTGRPKVGNYPLIAIMKMPPHKLSAEERKALQIADSSKIAYTALLNGKMAFYEEWANREEMGFRIEFNHNPDNSDDFFSSVIKFKAKPAQYKRYINQIKDCLKTIKWNDKVTMVL